MSGRVGLPQNRTVRNLLAVRETKTLASLWGSQYLDNGTDLVSLFWWTLRKHRSVPVYTDLAFVRFTSLPTPMIDTQDCPTSHDRDVPSYSERIVGPGYMCTFAPDLP